MVNGIGLVNTTVHLIYALLITWGHAVSVTLEMSPLQKKEITAI